MTERRLKLAELPAWPRGLSRSQAAAYIGVSANTFTMMVEVGVMPIPKRVGARAVWDRLALDIAFDLLP